MISNVVPEKAVGVHTTHMQYQDARAITRLITMAAAHPSEANMKGCDSKAGAMMPLINR